MRPLSLAALVAAIAAAALGAVSAAEAPGSVIWYAIVDDQGAQIGHASQQTIERPEGRETIDTQEIAVGEPRGSVDRLVWRTVLTEKAGHVVSISVQSQVGRSSSRSDARIESDKAEITRTTSTGRRTHIVALPAGVRFDDGDGLLPAWNPAATPRLTFDNFNVDAMVVERVVIEPATPAPADAGRTAVLRKRYEGAELRGVARLLLDRERRIVEVATPMFGTGMTIRMVDRATALASHAPFRVFPGVTMKSPFRISATAAQGRMRYRYSFSHGIEFEIPQTGEQRVVAEPGIVTVDICDGCGPGMASDKATLADALKPTSWLESDARRIREIAEPVKQMIISDTAKMEQLMLRSKRYLGKVDFVGHYTALETLSRRSADCTEAAVLLAALGRAAGIPTRVVNGLVYSQVRYHGVSNAFMPHSWVVAFADGKWRSFDLALGKFDATHIVLTVGDGDERSILAARQLSGLLRWDSMAEVRTPTTN